MHEKESILTVCYCDEICTLSDLKNGVHLAGIGGVGMTALAEMLLDLEIDVQGTDTTVSKNVERLRARGVKIFTEHRKENVGDRLVCRTRAVKDDNEEVIASDKVVYRSTLLQCLAKGKKQIVVTGAHGKTTTSAFLAHCLEFCGYDISYAVGGLSESLDRYGKIGSSDLFVIEGDESDGSHLKTEPYGGILTSTDVDHLAFWKDGQVLVDSYLEFSKKVKEPSHFFYYGEDKVLKENEIAGTSYGRSGCNLNLENLEIHFKESFFDQEGERITVPMYGEYNALNALAVYGFLKSFGLTTDKIKKAFKSFKGVMRRMEYLGHNVYSDYAHHPEEVKSVMKDIDEFREDLVIIFEPHRLSRFSDEIEGFCQTFKDVVITDIFEASEGLNIDPKPLLKEFCERTGSIYVPLHEIPGFIKKQTKTVLTLGAGPLDALVRKSLK